MMGGPRVRAALPDWPSPSCVADPRAKDSSRVSGGGRKNPAMVASLSLSGAARQRKGLFCWG